jgi:hypothetical protein
MRAAIISRSSGQQPDFAAITVAKRIAGSKRKKYASPESNYIEDYLAYGLLPDLGYLALLVTAVAIYLEKDFGLTALAGALLLLAIVNICNAWDLTLTMVRWHRRAS